MPLKRLRREVIDLQNEVERYRSLSVHLQMEVTRLEHALTTAEILRATLEAPKIVIFDSKKDLTPRETDVLMRIMAGDSNEKMAISLFMSVSTVKSHITKIYQKLNVHNRGGAAMAGAHMGLDETKKKKKIQS